jgi:hypothetical protein
MDYFVFEMKVILKMRLRKKHFKGLMVTSVTKGATEKQKN